MKIVKLQEIFVEELRDLFDAEKQLTKALPKMAGSASDSELQQALRKHLEETRQQVGRLEQIFGMLHTPARSKPCAGMKGLVEEGKEILEEDFEDNIRDAAITGAGRRVEHYEIAAYSGVIEMAQQLGSRDAAQLLQQTLREEMEFEKTLSQIARRMVKAVSHAGETGSSSRGGRPAGRTGAKAKAAQGKSTSRGRRPAGGGAHPLMDHEEIRRWAEERGAHPACVKGTGGRGDTGMIRLDFPGWSGEESLQEISWDDWFDKFDERSLVLMVQDETARGEKSNFNKLVSRSTALAKAKPKVKHAGGR